MNWCIFSHKSETSEADLLDIARTVPILILNDLGAPIIRNGHATDFSILNYRMNEQLPTIITTNLNFDEIEQHLERTCSDCCNCRVSPTAPGYSQTKYIQREKKDSCPFLSLTSHLSTITLILTNFQPMHVRKRLYKVYIGLCN